MVNLVTEKDTEGRVYVSTLTLMRLIDETHDGQRKFGVGYFDLVIIDEARTALCIRNTALSSITSTPYWWA